MSISAFRLLDAVGLGDFATQRADQLSGGQRQRVGIARALMQEPDLILADEPTSSLDPKTSVEIMELIAQRAGERDIPAVVNIHNVELGRRFADRIIGMSKGEIVFDGPPGKLQDSDLLDNLWRRRLARMSVAPASPARRLPAELAGAHRRARRCSLMSPMPRTILDITWARFVIGLDHGRRFLARMFPPDFAPDKMELLYSGMLESLQIAILATVFGTLISLPLGIAAARNLSPLPVAWIARLVIVIARTFHPIIVAILFVKAVGFGALAGVLALIVASVGFVAKLVADAVEETSMKQIEAVRATGAPFLSVIVMGLFPQVLPRFIGFTAYELDSNLRNSALVGLVGGGGIGATMFTAFQRFDYDFVLTIVLTIIVLVMIGEIISGAMRRLFQ